jgi:hypothetical protein
VQKVDYAKLREKLLADGQILAWDPAAKGQTHDHQGLEEAPRLPGIVIDDTAAVRTGTWLDGSVSSAVRIGTGYIHDGDAGKGEKTLTWSVAVPKAGEYEIVLHFPPNGNRAGNVPVTVEAGGEPKTFKINEKSAKTGGIASLGKYQLTPGKPATVRISNTDTDGYVAADGLQLLPTVP